MAECESSAINLRKGLIPFSDPESGTLVERNRVGTIVVGFDFAAMFLTLIVIWSLMYSVRVDAERHRKLLFETQEFAVEVSNLPPLSADYPIELLKAELWDHLETLVKNEK